MAGNRYQDWLQNGRVSAIVVALTFIPYVVFRLLKIDAPELANAFVAALGLFLGNIGIAQGRKAEQTQHEIRKLKEIAVEQHPEVGDELQ